MKRILLILLLALVIVQSYAIISLSKNRKQERLKLKNKIEVLTTTKKVLFKKIINTGLSVSIPFDVQGQLLESSNGSMLRLMDLAGSSPKVVFRISDRHCGECILAQLPFLKKLSDSIGKENVVILGSYLNFKNLKIFMTVNKLDYPYYNLPSEALSYLDIEMQSSPYYFEMEKQKTGNIFLPEKELPELTDIYIRGIIANRKI